LAGLNERLFAAAEHSCHTLFSRALFRPQRSLFGRGGGMGRGEVGVPKH
jgi:hypothetical protein